MKGIFLHLGLLFVIISGLLPSFVFGQEAYKKHRLSVEIEELIYSKPDEALKIAQHLLSRTSITDYEKAKINLLIAKTYYIKGDYGSALTFLFEEKDFSSHLSDQNKFEIEGLKIGILRDLSLDKEAILLLESLEQKAELLSENQSKTFANAVVNLEKAKFKVKQGNLSEGLELLQKQLSAELLENYPDLVICNTLTLAQTFLAKKELSQSKILFEQALLQIKDRKQLDLYTKTSALSGLASVYFIEKQHEKAALLLNEALSNLKDIHNSFLKETVLRQQIVNSLALNDTINYKKANTLFIKINFESTEKEQDAINVAYNLISEEYSSNYEEQKQSYYNILYKLLLLFLVIVCICFFFWWQFYNRKKSLKEIINYLEITRNNFISKYTEKKEESKKIFIPKETEQIILSKLKRFENSTKFVNKDMSLAVLAGQFDTNTKYLSEIINSNYHVNFNTYINKLRINYIVNKLKDDPNYMNYKISYLAEDCGFTSHSSFTTVFKSITGISPVTFIELLKEEMKEAV